VVAAVIYALMTTWYTGRKLLSERFRKQAMPLELFLDDVKGNPPPRVPGTAVFMAASAHGTPPVLLHHLKHNKVLHEQVVLLSMLVAEQPTVPVPERVLVEELGAGFFRVVGRYGFMQTPSVPEVMVAARKEGLRADTNTTSFYLGRETLLPSSRGGGMARWRKTLFFFMSRNARAATDYFQIPPGRVVELGMQLDL
jgi:KUP system potassium uptake protein